MTVVQTWAAPADIPAVRAFLLRVYGPDAVQAAPGRFDWLCAAHPRGLHVSLARDGERIVAACCHVPVRLALGDRVVDAAFGLDFIVDPAWRGRGLATGLLALRLERFAASLSTGQSPAMAALYARAGGRAVGPLLRALRVRRLPAAGAPRALARDWAAWTLGRLRGRGSGARAGTRRAVTTAEAAARIETWGPRLRPDEAGTRPDAADFVWRYGGSVYRDHACWEVADGLARGLLVTRREGDAEVVVDLFASPADLPAIVRATAATATAPRLTAVCHGARLAATLRAAGWLVRPEAAQFVVLAREPALLAELAGCPWLVLAGESDLDLRRRPTPAAPGGGDQ